MDCIFCKINKGEIPSYKLYEDDLVMVIMDAYPDSDGHLLVIPKEHYDTLLDIPDNVLLHINKIAKTYLKLVINKLNKKEATILINYGDSQKIKHYHLHIIPDFGKKSTKSIKEVYEVLNG